MRWPFRRLADISYMWTALLNGFSETTPLFHIKRESTIIMCLGIFWDLKWKNWESRQKHQHMMFYFHILTSRFFNCLTFVYCKSSYVCYWLHYKDFSQFIIISNVRLTWWDDEFSDLLVGGFIFVKKILKYSLPLPDIFLARQE